VSEEARNAIVVIIAVVFLVLFVALYPDGALSDYFNAQQRRTAERCEHFGGVAILSTAGMVTDCKFPFLLIPR
jgi:hypothetical protein